MARPHTFLRLMRIQVQPACNWTRWLQSAKLAGYPSETPMPGVARRDPSTDCALTMFSREN